EAHRPFETRYGQDSLNVSRDGHATAIREEPSRPMGQRRGSTDHQPKGIKGVRDSTPASHPPTRIRRANVSSGALEDRAAGVTGEARRTLRLPPVPRLPGGVVMCSYPALRLASS